MDETQKRELISSARTAREAAYAPYSKYQVGAALLTAAGKIFSGCNVENASYGLCFCAERTAIVKAISEGEQKFVAIAVATADGGTPCGACRQFMAEFCSDDLKIVIHKTDQPELETEYLLGDLLPHAFRCEP